MCCCGSHKTTNPKNQAKKNSGGCLGGLGGVYMTLIITHIAQTPVATPAHPPVARSLARSLLSSPACSPRVWPSGRPDPASVSRRALAWARRGGDFALAAHDRASRPTPITGVSNFVSSCCARGETRETESLETRGRRRGLVLGDRALRSAGEAGRGSASAAEHAAGTARERWLRLRGVNSKIKPQFDARCAATRREREAERPSAPLTRCSSTRPCAAEELDAGHTLRHGYFE